MKLRHGIISGLILLIATGGIVVYIKFSNFQKKNSAQIEELIKNTEDHRNSDESATSTPKGDITILLLGLDSRKDQTSARCDAIHVITLHTDEKTLKITSIPRGTYVYIPPGTYPENESYFSNACELAGYDYVKGEIEKMLQTKIDYTMKVGFSQTLGVLRSLKLPTTQSLQWLRNRQSFLIGDPQRSHDQALFIKDVALKKLDVFKNPLWYPVAKVAYSYIETDLDFDSAYALLTLYATSDLEDHPERIELAMNPPYRVKDLHFDFEHPEAFLQKFPKLTPDATTTISVTTTLEDGTVVVEEIVTTTPGQKISFADAQRQIIGHITLQLNKHASLEEILRKKLWLQIEDEKKREDLHFKIMNRLVEDEKDAQKKIDIITRYIQEKDALELPEWSKKGKDFMNFITTSSTVSSSTAL